MNHRRSWFVLGGTCALSLAMLAACANGLIDPGVDLDAGVGTDTSTSNPDTGTTPDSGVKTDAGCAAGETKCGPQCSNLQTDSLHCGTCQVACTNTQACEKGECHLACSQPTSRCSTGDGGVETCVDLKKDSLNCGTCGTTCAQSFVCDAGGCDLVCGDAGTKCPGTDGGPTCLDTTSDKNNCGACGVACTGGKVCVASTCQTVALSNIAPQGTMTSSGGGSGSYGPAKANDNVLQASVCSTFCWTNGGSAPAADWLQVTWGQSHVVSSISVDTNSTGTDACGNSGRCLAGAQVQWWNGASWITATTISGQVNDWSYSFPAPVTTTQLRLYGVYAAGGQASNPIIFEWQVMGQ
jgi:hypothetical protein